MVRNKSGYQTKWWVLLISAVLLSLSLGNHGFVRSVKDIKIKAVAMTVAGMAGRESASPREQIVYVHDWLISNTLYNYYNANNDIFLESDHTAEGPFLTGRATCQGYAEAFDLCMDILGIPCRIAISSNHAWNEVKVDNRWLIVDVSGDDTDLPKAIGRKYEKTYLLVEPDEVASARNYIAERYY